MTHSEVVIRGTAISRGIAIGRPFFFAMAEDVISEMSVPSDQIPREIKRYRDALSQSQEDIQRLQQQLKQANIVEGIALLEAQLQMLQDPLLTGEMENEICVQQKNAEWVLQSVVRQYQKKFQQFPDDFFRERFKDIQDVVRRVMGHLKVNARVSLANLPPDSIVFSRELTVSDTAEAQMCYARAFVTECEGAASHAAILAKSRGTPYVTSIDFAKIDNRLHGLVIVDGGTGEIILNPAPGTLTKYQDILAQLQIHAQKLTHINTLKSETYDGYEIRLSANIEMATELEMLHQHGGHGVGLYRSEYLCMEKEGFPSEEEQFPIYRELVEKMHGLPIVIRTFDIGGDKQITGKSIGFPFEVNPFLGCRAIRFLLKEPEIFKTQLRAILRASAFGDVSIMFPMVSTVSELQEAKEILREAQQELKKEGQKQGKVRIGCMIEVPSAAIIADLLAKECDFLSIGTNDLVQYALAVDRGNHAMTSLYTPTHPSVIRLIKLIVHEANHYGIPVTVCGEVAADPRFTPLLLGLGVHELSVSTRYIPTVKHAIRNASIISATRLAEKALSLSTAREIQSLLDKEYQSTFPEIS